jgi:hypothetical protein
MSSVELERELATDLDRLGDRLVDEQFCGDLYRAVTNSVLRRQGGPDGHLSLSWGRAEEIVNELRKRRERLPLTLAQTGGEGEVSDLARGELERLGWTVAPLNTSRGDDAHEGKPRQAPHGDGEPPEWEREAHEEASANELRDA